MTQREMAEEEARLVQNRPANCRGMQPRDYIHQILPDRPASDYVSRNSIRESDCDALWEEVESGRLILSNASKIAIAARRRGLPPETVLAAVRSLLEQNKKSRCGINSAIERFCASPAVMGKPIEPLTDVEGAWRDLKKLAQRIGKLVSAGSNASHVEDAVARFHVDVSDAVSRLRRHVSENAKVSISRTRTVSACRLLGVDLPKPGQVADEKTFRKNAQQLRVAAHPDRLGEAYDNERYLAIEQALETLEIYNETVRNAQ
jgi:hypothetical protein